MNKTITPAQSLTGTVMIPGDKSISHRAVMFEDMARNLKPAAALGMATVWIETHNQWALEGNQSDFIHARTDNLENWLHGLLAEIS